MIDAMSDPVLEMLTLVDRGHRAAGRFVPGAEPDRSTLNLGPFQLQLASQVDGDRGTADALRDAGGGVRPDPQAGERPLEDPASGRGGRPDLRPDGPRAPGGRTPTARRTCRGTTGTIEFEDVAFQLSRPGRRCSKGINLTVRHGETIALVGPNGCGKTTLMNLLPRFWDVDSGAIRIDGHDVRDVRLRSLRRQIGMVTAGDDPVPGHDRQQHRLRRPRAPAGRRSIEAAEAGLRPPVHHGAAPGLRHPDRRARPRPLGRPAAADRPGPRHAPRPRHPDPRRGHQRRGHPGRGADPQGDRGVLAGPHDVPDLPQPRHRSSSPTGSS